MGILRKKRWIILLLVFFFLTIIIVVFLPRILLSRPGLSLLLPQLNERIQGQVSIESCTAGWINGLDCSVVQFRDQQEKIIFSAEKVTTERSLLQLLAAHRNVGAVTFYSPNLRVPQITPAQDDQTSTSVQSGIKEPEILHTIETLSEKSVKQERLSKPFWEGITGHLKLVNGIISAVNEQGNTKGLFDSLQFSAQLADGTVSYEVALQPVGKTGNLEGEGFFNLPVHNQPILPTLVSQTELEVQQFDVADVLPFVSSYIKTAIVPSGKGILNGKWQINTSGLSNIQLKGESRIHGLTLSGGILGEDKPYFKELTFAADVYRQGSMLDVSIFSLKSEPFTFEGKGNIEKNKGSLALSGAVDLPTLMTMFPTTLGVKRELQVTEGQALFSFSLEKKENNSTEVSATLQTDVVRGVFNNQAILLDNPFNLEVVLHQDNGFYSCPLFELKTSFVSITGSGSIDNFSFSGNADFGQASEEINTLFDTGFIAGGSFSLNGSSTVLDNQKYKVALLVNSENFSLDDATGEVAPEYPLHLAVTAILPPLGKFKAEAMTVNLLTENWLGKGSVSVSDMMYQNPGQGTYDIDTSLELAPVSALFRTFIGHDEYLASIGNVTIRSIGSFSPTLLSIGSLLIDGKDIALNYRDLEYQDQRITLVLRPDRGMSSTDVVSVQPIVVANDWNDYKPKKSYENGSTIDFKSRRLDLRELNFDSGLLQIPSAQITMNDWNDYKKGINVSFQAAFSMENVGEILHQKNLLASNILIGGDSFVSAQVSNNNSLIGAKILWKGSNIDLTQDNISVLKNQSVTAETTLELELEPGSNKIALSPYAITSDYLSLAGDLTLETGDLFSFTTNNIFSSDFKLISESISSLYNRKVTLKGDTPHKIKSSYSAKKDTGLSISYAGELKQLTFDGIVLSNPVFSTVIENNEGEINWQATLNQGKVQGPILIKEIDKNKLFYLDEPLTLLTDVQLNQAVVESLFVKQYPLLGGLINPDGVVSMQVETLQWPVGKSEKAVFTTVTDTSALTLSSKGILNELLTLFKLADEPLELKDSELRCLGEEKRVTCSPLRILVADSEMVMTGSVGFDGSLNYLLEIPVTEKLVGREGYKVLAGTTLSVPIKGTAEEPIFSKERVGEMITEIIAKAASQTIENELEKAIPDLWDRIMGN